MTFTQTYQKRIAALVMVVAMGFGFFSTLFVQPINAQVETNQLSEELLQMPEEQLRQMLIVLIMQLLQQISALQIQAVTNVVNESELKGEQDNNIATQNVHDKRSDKEDTKAVKCSINASKSVVQLGDRFEVDWYTDLANPSIIDNSGERGVKNSGERKYVAKELGSQRYAIGSSKHGIACSVEVEVVGLDAPAKINSFEAKLDGRSDKLSPYLFFLWNVSNVTSCSIIMNDGLLFSDLPSNSGKLLSRYDANEKYNVDFKKNNEIELRCQATNTRKDSTVREFKNVYMGADYNESYKSEYKGYIDERLFITTQNITKKEAYENCEKNADNNPDSELRCTWGGKLIYTNYDGKG